MLKNRPTIKWQGNKKQFWCKICQRREHNRKVEWISNIGKEIEGLEETPNSIIHLNATLKKVPNSKTPGHDGKDWYCFKKFTSIHDRLAIEVNRYLQETDKTECMIKGKTSQIKIQTKKNTPNNYTPIICLPMMWKIQTVQIREEIYGLKESK